MSGASLATEKKSKKSGFFSRIFGGSKKDTVEMDEGSNSINEQLVRDPEYAEGARLKTTGVEEADDLFYLGQKFRETSKWGLSDDSASYDAVKSAITDFNASLHNQLDSEDSETNMYFYELSCNKLSDLIASCDEYINTHDPWTGAGKARKRLVRQIKSIAQIDLMNLSSNKVVFESMSPEEQAETKITGMLKISRTLHLKTDNFNALRDSKATGGMASDVMKVNVSGDNVGGVQEGEKATHYFKFEDEFDVSEESFKGKFVLNNLLKRFAGDITEEDEKLIRERMAEQTQKVVDASLNLDSLTEGGKNAMLAINKLLSGASNTYEIMKEIGSAGLGKKTNVSRRNVATSRMAELLGVGNLVAKSETVEITDKQGNSYTGNLMTSAKGSKAAMDISGENKAGENEKTLVDASKNGGYQLKTAVSGGFQRDLCNLQILDCICGQVDRHRGNFLVSQGEDGELTGLQGIDNDAAFGLDDDFSLKESRKNRTVINNETGLLHMPFIDDGIARRIEAIDGSAIEYILKDLLTKEEIKAAVVRFNKIKQAIKNTRKADPSRFLENENSWNDDTAQEMINQNWKSIEGDDIAGKEAKKLRKELSDLSADDFEEELKLRGLHKTQRLQKFDNKRTYFGEYLGDEMVPGFSKGIGPAPRVKRHNKK